MNVTALPRRLDECVTALHAWAAAKPMNSWGFKCLDETTPWPRKSVAVIAGPKGGGKTSLALMVARHYAGTQGPVLYVLLEGAVEHVTARAYAQQLGVSQLDLLNGTVKVPHDDAGTIPLYIAPRLPLGDIEPMLDAIAQSDARPPLLVIDYVQKYATGEGDRRTAVADAMEELLRVTESREMSTLVASQTSRAGSRRARHGRTYGEDLVDVDSESGATEECAAVKLVITFKTRRGQSTVTGAKVVAPKNRFGDTGTEVHFTFDGPTGIWQPSPTGGADTEVARELEVEKPEPPDALVIMRDKIVSFVKDRPGRLKSEVKNHAYGCGSAPLKQRAIELLITEGVLRTEARPRNGTALFVA